MRITLSGLARRGSDVSVRRGAVSLEFLLVFPIVFFATLAVFQFGLISLAIQASTNAVIEGAQKAAAHFSPSANEATIANEVATEMNKYLNVNGLKIGNGGTAQILVERGGTSETVGTLPSGFTMDAASGPAVQPSEVRVTLCFPLVISTGANSPEHPIPDWLKWIGVSLASKKFQMSSRATLE